MGTNGCGKSTLLNILAGLRKADGGEIYFDGNRAQGRQLFIRYAGYVPQESSLIPELSVMDNLRLWYTDESLTDYLNAAVVAYNEQNDIRVEAVLVDDSEYVEAVNEASLGRSERPGPDLYLITNDCLEKAYLAGLATEITHHDMFRVDEYENSGAEADGDL